VGVTIRKQQMREVKGGKEMNDNTFWIVFWTIVFIYLGFSAYMSYLTVKVEVESNEKIQKLREDNSKQLRESLERTIEKIARIKQSIA